MPETPSYTYQTQADGTLPGASFRTQTEAFLRLLQAGIDGASGSSAQAIADAAAALAAAQAAQGAAATAQGTADAAQSAINALDSAVVHKTGNETIANVKTFTSSPVVPSPTGTDDSTKAANTAWVRALFSSTGGFAFGDDGKVYVDFSTMDPAIMQAVVLAMVQSGGGLAVDSNGQLYVDFDSMPTDKFEALLAQIHVPVWIGENGVGTEFYVNGSTGIDKTSDNYGKSAAKPWKTIAYATQKICQNYNINTRNVHINVAGGTYTEEVSLPLQSRTTGSITIRPASSSDVVNIVRTVTGNGSAFSHTGGLWYLEDLNISLVIDEQASASPSYPHIISSSDSTGSVTLTHCNLSFTDNSVAAVPGSKGQVYARLISGNSGIINFKNKTDSSALFESAWSGTKGNASITWLYLENGSTLQMLRPGSSAAQGYIYNVSGSFSLFATVIAQSLYRNNGTGINAVWNKINSPTGKQYNANTGGSISTNAGDATALASYFPGDTAGTVDTSTGSWIAY